MRHLVRKFGVLIRVKNKNPIVKFESFQDLEENECKLGCIEPL